MLLVGDRRGNRVLKYDKVSGERLGEFPVNNPGPLAVDAAGRLWIARGETEVIVMDAAGGQVRARPISGLGKVVGLSFAPHGRLYVADDKRRQIAIYRVDDLAAAPESTFGRRAQPGDDAPQRFYELIDVAAGPDGSVVTVDRLPVGGSRIARWPAQFSPSRPYWTHLGLEFTGNANYSPEDPDVLLSTYFQRYQLDRKTGGWQFRGNLFCGGNTGECTWHGAPRWVTLGGQRFFYFANGDGIQAYRLAHPGQTTELRFAMAIGGHEPGPDGKTERTQPPGQWTWTDSHGNSRLDAAEVRWFKQPGQGQLAYFGMNVDLQGNIFYCDHQTRSIRMIPLMRLNAAGNPVYDWSQSREIVPADNGPVKFFPLMAECARRRARSILLGRSDLFPPHAGAGAAWMGGGPWRSSTRRAGGCGRHGWCSTARAWTMCPGTAAWSWVTLPRPSCIITTATACSSVRPGRENPPGKSPAGWITRPRSPVTATRVTGSSTCSPRRITPIASSGIASTMRRSR